MSEAPTTDRIAQHTPGPWQQYMRGNQRSARLPRLISMTHLRSTTVNGEHTKPVESRTEDLVTALREARKSLEEMDATSFDGPPAVSLYLRAAAEIERLRETLTFPRITPEATAEQFMAILHPGADMSDPSKEQCPVCDTPDGDHLDWCTPQTRAAAPTSKGINIEAELRELKELGRAGSESQERQINEIVGRIEYELRAHETSAPKPCRGCGKHHEPPECSVAWLIEDGASPSRYRTADSNGFGWTLDVNKAIRLARRCDAEMLAAADDAAWKIVEHMWCSSPEEPRETSGDAIYENMDELIRDAARYRWIRANAQHSVCIEYTDDNGSERNSTWAQIPEALDDTVDKALTKIQPVEPTDDAPELTEADFDRAIFKIGGKQVSRDEWAAAARAQVKAAPESRESHYCIECNDAHDPRTCGSIPAPEASIVKAFANSPRRVEHRMDCGVANNPLSSPCTCGANKAVEKATENPMTTKTQVIGPCEDTQGADVAQAVGLVHRGVTDEQIKYMVDRFLGWRLPDNFSPDDGISFEADYNVEYNAARGKPPARRQPSGTNLFDATQAEAMVRYMVEGLPR